MKPINVGLLGIGTVGGGAWTVLARNREEISRRAGRDIRISVVADKETAKAKKLTGGDARVVADAFAVVHDPEVDIVIELIGGTTVAKVLVLAAIESGKHVVTANKALLATHGNEIFSAAQKKGVMVAFEGAVAGGIPIIKALREGLTVNRIEWIAGIINGTSNFILSEMRDKGLAFDAVLKEAQKRGYAEADPTFDIEGVDAAHKLTIMAAIAFGVPMQLDKCYKEGIARLTQADIRYAEQLGYRIKLLGITKQTEKGIELRVHPTLIPAKRLIANVEGVMNAVLVKGDAVGPTMYYGAGAGAEPTGSAVGRPRGRHAPAYGRSRAPRAASRVPARPHVQPQDPADGRGRDLVLPAHAGRGPPGRARRYHPHPRRRLDFHRCHGAARAGRRRAAGGHHHAHPPDAREEHQHGDRQDREAEGGDGEGDQDQAGRPAVIGIRRG